MNRTCSFKILSVLIFLLLFTVLQSFPQKAELVIQDSRQSSSAGQKSISNQTSKSDKTTNTQKTKNLIGAPICLG